MKIYVASSWRNARHDDVVDALDGAGHRVYDYRYPKPGGSGFHWSEIDPDWQSWSIEDYRQGLEHPLAKSGFQADWRALEWAEASVLVLPSGRSSHLEAGYFVGAKKPLCILLAEGEEPELMYKMASWRCADIEELMLALRAIERGVVRPKGAEHE